MRKRVLVALDGSPAAEVIVPEVPLIAGTEVEVVLLHVVPAPTPPVGLSPVAAARPRVEVEGYLEDVRKRFPSLRARARVEHGDPVEGILAAARAEGCDGIAMTTHGRTGLRRLLLGSVA